MAVASGEAPSPALSEAWTKAQEVRPWLTLGSADFETEASEGDTNSSSDANLTRLCDEV